MGGHFLLQCTKVKSESEVAQSCLTLSDPMDCNIPGSSIHGIFQARVLEWGAIAFSASLLWLIHIHVWQKPTQYYIAIIVIIDKKIRLQCRTPGFNPWVGKISWRRERLPIPVFWPREFHRLYSPWGHKELDKTEQISLSSRRQW